MDELEACELWIQRDFSMIPTDLILRAYQDSLDEIQILVDPLNEYDEIPIIPAWGWVFMPLDPIDQRWFEHNAQEVYEKTGVIVYYAPDIGIYLGIDGAGYDFYECHWLPLYRLRELRWHE